MEPLDHIRAILGRWKVIVAPAIVLAVLAIASGAQRPAERRARAGYEGTAILVPIDGRGTNLNSMKLLASVGEVPRRVAERVGWEESPVLLAAQVDVTADRDTGVLRMRSESDDPARAAGLPNEFARELLRYLDERTETRTEGELDLLETRQERLRAEISELDRRVGGNDDTPSIERAERDAKIREYGRLQDQIEGLAGERDGAPLEFLQEAVAVPLPVGEGNVVNVPEDSTTRAVVGAGLGIAAGLAAAFGLERLKPRVRTLEQAEAAFGLPVLSEIPLIPWTKRRDSQIVAFSEPRTPEAASFRLLQSAFSAFSAVMGNGDGKHGPTTGEHDAKTILVTSGDAGVGKTTVAANLAATLEEAGKDVIVVSADLRRPTIERFLRIPESPGLVQLLRKDGVPIERALHASAVPGVLGLPSGGTVENPAELLSRPRAREILAELRTMADAVVIDSTSLLDANDAIQLIPEVDAVLVVSRSGRTPQDAARRTGEFLRRMNATVLGIALVGTRRAHRSERYYSRVPGPRVTRRPTAPLRAEGESPRVSWSSQ